ncbi:MAG: IPT/TIG domain-containing protein, partial [Candidatus Omnitrophota bacterium]
TGRVNVCRALKTEAAPYFRIGEVEYEELDGNDNRIIDGGEKIKLTVTIKNLWKSAEIIKGNLSSNSQYISSISDYQTTFSKDDNQDSRYTGSFIFQTTTDTEIDTPMNFSLDITADGHSQALMFSLDLGIRKISAGNNNEISYPFVDNKRCVYVKKIDGIQNIFIYDFQKNREEQITSYYSPEVSPACLSISGEKLVWCDNRYGNYDIYLYDLGQETAGQKERRLTTDITTQSSPHIYGNKIVYLNMDLEGSHAVYLYDLDEKDPQKKNIRITDDSAKPGGEPQIWGDRIVWHDMRSGDFDIYMYDLKDKKERVICRQPRNQTRPRIFGDRIVWVDYRSAICEDAWNCFNSDIYLYDLKSNQESAVCVDPGEQRVPFIFGNWIAWEDSRDGNADVYFCELNENNLGTTTRVTKDSRDQKHPVICGNTIVWTDKRSPSGVYLAEVKSIAQMSAPEIKQITPGIGIAGSVVTITGLHFGLVQADSCVSFGGIKNDSIISWSDTVIICNVPPQARTGQIIVTTKQGISNSVSFIVNHPPYIFFLFCSQEQEIEAGQLLEFYVAGTDEDNDGFHITAAMPEDITDAAFVQKANALGGCFKWRPTAAHAEKSYYISFSAVDRHYSSSNTIIAKITVKKANTPPVFTAIPEENYQAKPGQNLSFPVSVYDADGDTVMLSANLISGKHLIPLDSIGAKFIGTSLGNNGYNTKTFIWMPNSEHGGKEYCVIFNAKDTHGASVSKRVTFTITLTARPEIDSIELSANDTRKCIIKGNNFGNQDKYSKVFFGIYGDIVSWSNKEIVCVLPKKIAAQKTVYACVHTRSGWSEWKSFSMRRMRIK